MAIILPAAYTRRHTCKYSREVAAVKRLRMPRMPRRAPRPARAAGPDSRSVHLADRGVAVVCWATSASALAQSYRGLYDFATQRGQVPGWAAVAFPLLLDSFLVMGELRLFSAVARHESARIKTWAWLLTAAGLIASLAGNIAHVGPGAPWAAKLAAAAAPLAAAASLGTGLGIVKLNATVRSPGKLAGKQVASSPLPETPARQPGSRPARRRHGAPAAAQLAAWIAEDRLAGRDMTRRQFATRHGISVHHARLALASEHNGAGLAAAGS